MYPHVNDGKREMLSHIPEICFIDDHHRSRILSSRCSLHISFAPDDAEVITLKPERTHLHYLEPPKNTDSQKLEVVSSYNRAIVVEFEKRELRDLGIQQIGSQKYNFGPTVLKPVVKAFKETESTRDTMWSLLRSKGYHSHSVHEALRRFFCLRGAVPSKVSILLSK